jgi:hypothetical protein
VTYTLVPPSCFLIGSARTTIIAELYLVKFGKVLLVSGGAAEVAFAAVVCDGLVQTSCSCLWVIFAVGLCPGVRTTIPQSLDWLTEGFCECVGFVIWLVELLTLDGCCLLESFASLLAWKALTKVHLTSIPYLLGCCVPIFCMRNAFAAAINCSAAASSVTCVSPKSNLELREYKGELHFS